MELHVSDSPVRILQVVGRMNRGGAESFIMNVYRNINRGRVQFDFAVNTKEESHFDEEILSLGGRIFPHPAPSETGIFTYCRLFGGTLSKHGPFAGVHSHVHCFSGGLLKSAAQAGIKLRIAHSQNSSDGRSDSLSRRMYRWYMKRLLCRYATHLFYCSNEAGLSLYGNNMFVDPRARIALRYPIGYDTRILFSFFQTPLYNKSRYRMSVSHDPKVKLLQEVLLSSVYPNAEAKVIEKHISKYVKDLAFSYIIQNDRTKALSVIKANQANIWASLLNMLIEVKPIWPVLRFGGWIFRAMRSRKTIKIIGGRKVSHGVLVRLQVPELNSTQKEYCDAYSK